MIPVAVHKSSGICLAAEKTTGNLSQETVDEGCATSHRLKCAPLPTNESGMIARHVSNGKKKEVQGDICLIYKINNMKSTRTYSAVVDC